MTDTELTCDECGEPATVRKTDGAKIVHWFCAKCWQEHLDMQEKMLNDRR